MVRRITQSFIGIFTLVCIHTAAYANIYTCTEDAFSASDAWEKRSEEDYILLDVRTSPEVLQQPYMHFHTVQHIPLSEIPQRLNELDKNKKFILGCRSGNRSLQACAFLEQKGFQVHNLIGGIGAWSTYAQQH